MKALKKIATIAVMGGILFTASGFTTAASITEHGDDVATVTVQVSGGRLG